MPKSRMRLMFSHLLLGIGAAAVLATGADHLYEYAADGFSSVPTIGILFLLNFIGATIIGVALLLPLPLITPRFGHQLRALLAVSGLGLAGTSLLALWISETSSLFGFSDFGFRASIVAAIVAESVGVVSLTGYLCLTHLRLPRRWSAAADGATISRREMADTSAPLVPITHPAGDRPEPS